MPIEWRSARFEPEGGPVVLEVGLWLDDRRKRGGVYLRRPEKVRGERIGWVKWCVYLAPRSEGWIGCRNGVAARIGLVTAASAEEAAEEVARSWVRAGGLRERRAAG